MAAEGGKLPRSYFFTEREAILPAHFLDSRGVASTSSSPRYYSPRIHALMECKSKLGMSEEEAEIEASKAHWTETKYLTATSENDDSSVTNCEERLSEEERLKLYEENVEVMRKLMEDGRHGWLFKIGGTLGGKKMGEGGQAEIYEGRKKYVFDKFIREEGKQVYDRCDLYVDTVMGVFKEGTSLLELQKQWPTNTFHYSQFVREEFEEKFIKISCAKVLDDGRVAFEMIRCLRDLRKLLDVRMEHNGNQYPPFMMEDGDHCESCMLRMMLHIVDGMRHFTQRLESFQRSRTCLARMD